MTTCTLIEYMPKRLRASHAAARNGQYLQEWVRGIVYPEALDPEWASVVRIAEQPYDDARRCLRRIPDDAKRAAGSEASD